ncbi:MAG TPA: response regulator [Verrucomicrobiae bacterium]|nr:response regulator [Verrucomicrobiae bacterium]
MAEAVVLVAEDIEEDFILLARAFAQADIRARLQWARDGAEARAYLQGDREFADRVAHPLPVIILADIKMPAMNGFDLLTWIKAQPYLRRIPVVMLTGSDRNPDINRAYDLGASSYLVKPHGFEELQNMSESLKNYWIVLNQRAETLHNEHTLAPP